MDLGRSWGVAAASLVVPAALGVVVSGNVQAQEVFPGSNGVIAFEHEVPAGDHTQTDLMSVSPDGVSVTRLTHTRHRNEFGPAWSPTGAELAFWRTRAPFGPGSLWVMDSVGSSLRRLTTGIDARDPAWNPAGTRLVYTRASNDLFTLRASGGRRHQLTSGPALDFEPAWSPDGAQIAFTRAFSRGDPGDIYLLTLATGTIMRVTHSPGYDHQVGWAPGGHLLVFERDAATGSSIWTVRPDGSHLRRLSGGQHFDTGPAFSPDGAQIVFASDRHQVGTDLWVMDRAGGTVHRLVRLRFLEGAPDWQPVIP